MPACEGSVFCLNKGWQPASQFLQPWTQVYDVFIVVKECPAASGSSSYSKRPELSQEILSVGHSTRPRNQWVTFLSFFISCLQYIYAKVAFNPFINVGYLAYLQACIYARHEIGQN